MTNKPSISFSHFPLLEPIEAHRRSIWDKVEDAFNICCISLFNPESILEHFGGILAHFAIVVIIKITKTKDDGLFNGASIVQMGAGLDYEIRLDLEIGPITIYIYLILEYETLETNVENDLII